MALLIAIEGIDGSGKGTQARILTDRLNQKGISAELVSFPRYDQTFFGSAIGDFLNGKFGSLGEVNPFLASLLYAGDRFESRPKLLELLEKHEVVVLDRYVASNIAHQGSKASHEDQTDLIQKIEKLEFEIYELPKPDLNILLEIPVMLSQLLIAKKEKRNYTDKKADLQEADTSYLSLVRDVYLKLAENSSNWKLIPVNTSNDDLSARTIDEISDDIWNAVKELREKS